MTMPPISDPPYDLAVVGSTAPGIVAAVRAAREGLRVVLVAPGPFLGGCLPSLGAVETHYRGNRAPLLQEFIEAVKAHYRAKFGITSEAYLACAGRKMVTFEPHVAEAVLEKMVAGEARLDLRRGLEPISVLKEGTALRAVTFRDISTAREHTILARTWIEATYEGDLMALAGASFRVGREARAEFGEPRAGRVFTRWLAGTYPRDAAEGRLNLVTAGATTSEPLPGSTGEGDDNLQSYSYRLCLTDNPSNRRMLAAPPAGYDRATYAPILLSPEEKAALALPFHHRFLIHSLHEMAERDHLFHGHALPNRKRSWNATNLTGAGKGYAAADREGRRQIARRHLDHALGLLWFLQNDPDMPADLGTLARQWGLAADEFVATDNLPPQLYVREARRLVGRRIFTEHDALIAPDAKRAPIHADSIGITEFSLDSLACTTERMPGSLCDGQLFQMEVSRPGQVPFGTIVPRELDNLLVVTTVSTTHVGWGTVRQTPTLMHLAESAAWAVVLASRAALAPANVDVVALQRVLVEQGIMISFFNDFDLASTEAWVPAIQFHGTRGLFPTYDAHPDQVLRAEEIRRWEELLGLVSDELAGLEGGTRADACLWLYRKGGVIGSRPSPGTVS